VHLEVLAVSKLSNDLEAVVKIAVSAQGMLFDLQVMIQMLRYSLNKKMNIKMLSRRFITKWRNLEKAALQSSKNVSIKLQKL
jgi:hypothetical protein